MMGPNNLGDINDMLTLCERLPEDIGGNVIMDWTKSIGITGFKEDDTCRLVMEELEKEGLENRNFYFYEFEMTYKSVEEKMPVIREDFKDLVLHLAAHNVKNTVILEPGAFSTGYTQPDKNGLLPKTDGENLKTFLESQINFDNLQKTLSEKQQGVKIEKSQSPERSIAAYLYSLSLRNEATWPSLLVKIPPIDETCTKEAIAEVIRELIQNAISQF